MTRLDQAGKGAHADMAALVNARLDRVPLHRHALTAAGRAWVIEAVKDQDALLAAAEHFAAFPYGLLLWESAIVMADALSGLGPLAGKRVLELGAGVGVAGLAARHLGAAVLQTDHADEALELCRRNAALNGIDGIAYAFADWARWDVPGQFDIIVGSDILYDGSAHAMIADVLTASLGAGGVAALTDPGRTATAFFIRDMTAAGWRITQRKQRIDAIHPVRSGEAVEVAVMMIRRA